MKRLHHIKTNLILVTALALTATLAQIAAADGTQPVADAGLPRYAATEAVVLDGTGSYDPNEAGLLSYTWQQVSGPPVSMSDAETATPTISDFVQTDEIQACEFELTVSNGESTSRPDTVQVIIVPDFGDRRLELENPPFDPNKPTIVYFAGGNAAAGGDVINGLIGNPGHWNNEAWNSHANVIGSPSGYYPDGRYYEPWATYYSYGDLLIVYLSNANPNYQQPIQTMGFSLGGCPCLDVGIRLNAYADARYAVNRVTAIDAATRAQPEFKGSWDMYIQGVELFLGSSVDGEPCWLDFYYGAIGQPYEPFPRTEFLQVRSGLPHSPVRDWYRNSITSSDMNKFNGGVVAGAYWSVVGPGKNLQLARSDAYYFHWDGDVQNGSMNSYDETKFPGRLPEPVTLIGPPDGEFVGANGAILSCEVSENSIGYQLLFGQDPYHMVYLLSDTPTPPNEPVTTFPFEKTWWTVKTYDPYGSTIHADPILAHAGTVSAQIIANESTGQRYASIQQAINDAHWGDEIVVSPGVFQHLENINFKGKSLTVKSTDPNDPAVVAATVINGGQRGPVIKLSGSQGAGCVIEGLTIIGGTVGVSCVGASPTIRNCTIEGNSTSSMEFSDDYEPTIINCNIQGQVSRFADPRLAAYWKLDETGGDIAYDSAGENHAAMIGDPTWQPGGGQVDGALQFDGVDDAIIAGPPPSLANGPLSVFVWVQGGAPGQAIISEPAGPDWLSLDPLTGHLMTELTNAGRSAVPLHSQAVITDGNWHRIGFVWDGLYRTLYVDGVAAAEDTQDGLASPGNGFYIGAGKAMAPGTYFSGMIDDVRIYNRAVKP